MMSPNDLGRLAKDSDSPAVYLTKLATDRQAQL
jgi:hypothetical protein